MATSPGAFVSAALAGCHAVDLLDRRPSRRSSRSSGGRTSRSSRRSSSTCRSASTSTSRPASRTSGSASSRRAASCRRWTSRTRTRRSGSSRCRTSAGRTCSTASPAPNAVAASRPARPGTPGNRSTRRRSSWVSGTCRSRPSTASTSSRTRRSCARRTGSTTAGRAATAMAKPIVDDAIPYDAVWDCVTCGACVEACPVLIEHVDKIVGLRRNLVLEESRFPQELTAAFRSMEGQGNPWGQPASTRHGLDAAVAVRGADGRVARRRRRARRPRGPVLGRLCRGVRSAQPEGRAGGGDVPARGRRLLRGARPGRVVHRRPGPPDGQRLRVPDPRIGRGRDAEQVPDGRADDRHRLPALLQHDRQRVRAARRVVPDRPPLDVSSPNWSRRGGWRPFPRTPSRRPATIGLAA